MDNTTKQIDAFIASQPEPKQSDIRQLHQVILELKPGCRLWFDEGKDAAGKTVTNPTIGYGSQLMRYADGKTKEFFRIGVSANATGISVYILGIKDKTYLAQTYGEKLGKAKVTGYCIRFKKLADIDAPVLADAIRFGLEYGEGESVVY